MVVPILHVANLQHSRNRDHAPRSGVLWGTKWPSAGFTGCPEPVPAAAVTAAAQEPAAASATRNPVLDLRQSMVRWFVQFASYLKPDTVLRWHRRVDMLVGLGDQIDGTGVGAAWE
jgi:hypothetical protein